MRTQPGSLDGTAGRYLRHDWRGEAVGCRFDRHGRHGRRHECRRTADVGAVSGPRTMAAQDYPPSPGSSRGRSFCAPAHEDVGLLVPLVWFSRTTGSCWHAGLLVRDSESHCTPFGSILLPSSRPSSSDVFPLPSGGKTPRHITAAL